VGDSVWSEQELVRRCKEGSEAAYAELVHQHRSRLLNLAYRLTGDPHLAEDVVQETFLAAFRAMERFEPQPALAPWLNTIAVRLAGRHASRRAQAPGSLDRPAQGSTGDPPDPDADGVAGHRSVAAQLPADTATEPETAAVRSELRRELQEAIAALPYKQRAAVVLRLVMGLDYAEAAQTMDVPLNTFKSHLLRGTRGLREALGDRLGRGRPAQAAAPSAASPAAAPASAGPSAAASGSAASAPSAASAAASAPAPAPGDPEPRTPPPPAPPSAASSSGASADGLGSDCPAPAGPAADSGASDAAADRRADGGAPAVGSVPDPVTVGAPLATRGRGNGRRAVAPVTDSAPLLRLEAEQLELPNPAAGVGGNQPH
jgi:RNA polymerase sigma-70 factor (ECF subfamily)